MHANWAASPDLDNDKVVTSNVATMNHFADRSPRRWAAVNQATRITPNRANGLGDMISRVPLGLPPPSMTTLRKYRVRPTTAAMRNAIDTARKLSFGRHRPTDAPINSTTPAGCRALTASNPAITSKAAKPYVAVAEVATSGPTSAAARHPVRNTKTPARLKAYGREGRAIIDD